MNSFQEKFQRRIQQTTLNFSRSLMDDIAWEAKNELEEGIKKTLKWYLENENKIKQMKPVKMRTPLLF
jgi:dTDP-D-glucose 4,6-dehydratase